MALIFRGNKLVRFSQICAGDDFLQTDLLRRKQLPSYMFNGVALLPYVQIIVEPQTLPPDSGCAICKSQGPLPCVRDTVQVGGATCHVTCINFWYTFISE